MTFPLGPLGNKLLAAAASGVAASAVYVTAKVTFSFCAWTFYAGCALVSAKLLFGKYYRSLEDSTSHFTGFGTEIGMTDLDPALLHNQHQHQDRIDLNLHLAPPPMESTYGFLPLGSGFGVDMLNPSPAAGIPNHSTMWPRLTTSSSSVASTTTTGAMFSSMFFDNISSGPPSPGEIDFTAFQQQPPFWGFDFPEADLGHHEHLDLDLSPLLHEHFLQEQEVQIGSSRENRQTRNAAIQPPASSRRTPSAAATDALHKNYATGAGSCFTKKNSGSASASADASSPQQQANNNSKEEEDPKSSSNWKDFFFDCNVCLDVASEPVVTSCGHLFCWPCLYQWLHVHSHNAECPVCKGAVSDSDIVPIYGRGSAAENIPSTDIPGNVPPRPRARRSDPVRQRQAARWRGGGDHMLHEMLRWRRAVQFMQENVDRIFNHGGGNNHHHHHRRPRRRMPERREQQHFARSAAEDALLAAMHERMGMPSMEMEHTAASIQARIASVEGMIDQLHHPWQTPPPPFIDLTTPDTPLFTPMLPRDPAAAYPILHGLRRMPV